MPRQEPLLSLRRLDDFCDPRITRTLAIAVAATWPWGF
jgi:hypothetical protein